ncbi:hypothetical protein [Thiobacillus denitrificans]|uniref:hypothetical protein n=1 Tax=Thiobacillus denitrificans TaxID=36861 RepID=UPI00037BB620|nr:hypothetical protein [Thiobacillus denitrificans]
MADHFLESMQHASARTCCQDDVNADDPILVIVQPFRRVCGVLDSYYQRMARFAKKRNKNRVQRRQGHDLPTQDGVWIKPLHFAEMS